MPGGACGTASNQYFTQMKSNAYEKMGIFSHVAGLIPH
jgi:hypothetical protein